MSLPAERCPFPIPMTLPFIVQGGPSLKGLVEKRKEREREREREFSCPAGQGYQLCQSGPPTPLVGVLVRPPPMS
jgi:hypothetical protein